MAVQPFTATIIGIPNIPSITEVNVRSGPGTNQNLAFKTTLGVKAQILDVQIDAEGRGLNNKIYQWFLLSFPNNLNGWVRDDLITVEGDGARFGYGTVSKPTLAFNLIRQIVTTPPATTTPPTTPSTPTTGSTTPGVATAIGKAQTGANVRSGPGTLYSAVGKLDFNARAQIVGSKPEDNNGTRFRWVQIRLANGVTGYVRENFIRMEGDLEAFKAGKNDTYPAPMINNWWVRDFNPDNPNFEWGIHLGWDLGANVGEPLLIGPQGGTVIRVFRCQRCTPNAPSVRNQGIPLNDPSVLNDPNWGYGYGHYVIIRYLNQQLPASSQQYLASRNLAGAHIYAMYAHLNSIECNEGQSLPGGARFATCGNSGNSEGAHLHLELRASLNPNELNWSNMRPNLLDPIVLYRR